MKKSFCIILFLLLQIMPVFSQNTLQPGDLWMHTAQFQANGRDSAFALPHRFLLPGSLTVTVDSLIRQEKKHFYADLNQGLVRFIQPPDSGRMVRISYGSLPVRFQLVYSRWTAVDTLLTIGEAPSISVKKPDRTAAAEMGYTEELQRSGSIFRGITVGTNQGMRLESGLRLQVSGKVAPNVEVVASLTDQNTPIQPEGNTQTLQEIDKVYIQVEAPHFCATLGDFVFDQTGTCFGLYSRKLQGASATVESGSGAVTLLASASKGEFTTHYFNGQEGNQGPYQLTGSRGQRDIIVLAGTERITIDGEPMMRGEDNDYVIEYGTGQITFTRKRLITGDSRISVDFEFSDQKFQKGIYGAAGEARFWNDRLKIRALFVRESDNKDNPLDFSMTDEYKSVLENAGDCADSAATNGARFVGAAQGSYVQSDSSGQVVYRYAGPGRGDWIVRFSYVGQGKGDYSFQGYDIYRYEGAGRGSYLPFLFLPMPRIHQIADAYSSIRLGEGFSAESEIAVSSLDLNQFSPRDDWNNNGLACSGTFRMAERQVGFLGRSLGRLGLEASVNSVDDRFRPLGRIHEVEYGRKWGTVEGVTWGEKTGEIKGNYRPFDGLGLSGGSGTFRRGSAFHSQRTSVGLEWKKSKTPSVRYDAEWIRTQDQNRQDGFWLRQNGNVEAVWKGFRPRLTFEAEHRKDAYSDTLETGFKFDVLGAVLGFERRSFRVEFEEQIRDDRQYRHNRLDPLSLAETRKAGLQLRGSLLNASFFFTHRNRNYHDPGIEDQKTDLADFKAGFSLFRRFLDGTLHYQFSSTQVSEMVKDTIRVGQGLGNYRYDAGFKELVPDPDGDIIFRTIQTGTFLPVNDLKAGADLRLDGSRLFGKGRGAAEWLGRLSSRSLIRMERRDRERRFASVNRSALYPNWGADSTTVNGIFSILEDLEFSMPKNRLYIRLRLRKDDSENRQLLQEGLVRHVLERTLQIKGNPVDRLGFFAEYENRQESKQFLSGYGLSRDIRSNALSGELSYRPRQILEFAFKTKMKSAEDVYPRPHTQALSIFFFPRMSYSIRERGQLRAELEIGRIHAEPSGRTLPYEMFSGDQTGKTLRVNLLFTYKVASHIMATLSYRARKEPWHPQLYQTAQIEARAFF